MSRYKVVVAVTGSIAAYKSCELVSLLKKQGHQVRVIMTRSAEKFVGKASLEALSGLRVENDDFHQAEKMTHLELGRWCDATVIYPATAQTINSLSHGVGQELLTSFFLGFNFQKPFLVAPAMNTRMLDNPITKRSLKALKELGCVILPTDSGELACGDVGDGRLLAPEKTLVELHKYLGTKEEAPKKILITAGGTRETIDGVRTLTNMSTGQTGAALANHLTDLGYQVLLLTSSSSHRPKPGIKVDTYQTFSEIYNTLRALSQSQKFDGILHAAAISDYSIATVKTPDGDFIPGQSKMSSKYNNISIELKRNEKILPRLKSLFGDDTKVVGFKLTSTESKEEQAKAIFSLFTENAVDYVVHNDMHDIKEGRREFLLTSKQGQQQPLSSVEALAQHISTIFQPQPELGGSNDLMS